MLALIGMQRREATLCLQDNWVQVERKGRRGPRAEGKEKAQRGGVKVGKKEEEGGLG